MEKLLKDFEVPPKNASEEAFWRWRKAVSIVRNNRRRSRMVVDLAKRAEAAKKLDTRRKLQVAQLVQVAVWRFTDAAYWGENGLSDEAFQNGLSEEAKREGYRIHPDKLANMVHNCDMKTLRFLSGVEGLASRVKVSCNEGVKSSDVDFRQKIYGFNKFTEKPSISFWMFVLKALQDLFLLVLMVCAVVSIGVGLATEGWPKGMYDGVGIILSIFLVVIVTAVSDYNQSFQLKALDEEEKKIFVQVIRDGVTQKVVIHDLVVGDIVHLSIGDLIPADGIFISGFNLLVEQSSMSGEIDPVEINEKKPFLFTGAKVKDGSGKMLVSGVGMQTKWGKWMDTHNEVGEDETPLQVKLNGVLKVVGISGFAFAVLTFLVLAIRFLVEKAQRHEFTSWSSSDALKLLNYFATAVTTIFVAFPDGLPLAVTLSHAFAMKKLMDTRAFVRHRSACGTMGSATCICTDQTGILTTNDMMVDKAWMCGKTKEIRGRESRDGLNLEVSDNVFNILMQAIFLNSGSEVVKEKDGKNSIIGPPIETALLKYGLLLGGDFDGLRQKFKMLKVERVDLVKKKIFVLVALPGGGTRAFCKGASEIILRMCDKILDSDGKQYHLSEEQAREIKDVINGFACEALRTLCLAFKDTPEIVDANSIPDGGYTLITVVGIKDPVRPGVREAVRTCLAAGITVCMVTGDNINTAKAIAKECGILTEDGQAIEGPEFSKKTSDEINEILPKLQVMARSLPSDKLKLVKHLKGALKEVVAVTGDGTNDAPALHESDIGLAMGISETQVAKESADVIIMDNNFTTIVNLAKWGRAVCGNIQKFLQFELTVNVVILMINFLSACISGSAPLTAVQLLWVNLIMDTLGALALATEPPHDGLMNRPPVGRGVSFITKAMKRNIIGQGVYQLAVLLVLQFDGKQLLSLAGSDANEILSTFIFNTFVFCQVFNEINSRDIEKINVFRGMLNSWTFIGVVVCIVAFQVMIVEFLGNFASTVPLSWQLWLLSVLIGAVSMIISLALKCIPVETEAPSKHHDGYDLLPNGPDLV